MSEAAVLRIRDEALAGFDQATTWGEAIYVLQKAIRKLAVDLAETVFTAIAAKSRLSHAQQNWMILNFLEELAQSVLDSYEAAGMSGHYSEAASLELAQDAYLGRLEALYGMQTGGSA